MTENGHNLVKVLEAVHAIFPEYIFEGVTDSILRSNDVEVLLSIGPVYKLSLIHI